MQNECFDVEVAYATPDEQRVVTVTCGPETTIREAIERSGLMAHYPEINLAQNKVGIYGKLARLNAVLRPRDRIEIYRPLIADPKEIRRRRAEQGKPMKKGG